MKLVFGNDIDWDEKVWRGLGTRALNPGMAS